MKTLDFYDFLRVNKMFYLIISFIYLSIKNYLYFYYFFG